MQAGRHGRFRRVATRGIGASDPRFASLFDVGRETSRAATHVDARDGVLSDAGSTPAASTIYLILRQRLAGFAIRRLQHVSKPVCGFGLIEEPDRPLDRRGTEVHVPLRRGEIHMTGELLNGSCRCAAHREV